MGSGVAWLVVRALRSVVHASSTFSRSLGSRLSRWSRIVCRIDVNASISAVRLEMTKSAVSVAIAVSRLVFRARTCISSAGM